MDTPSPHKLLSATPKAPTTTLYVNLQAVKNNWQRLNDLSGPACQTGAVIKANGYGMGMEAVAIALYQAGCRLFFTARIDEAHHLLDIFDKAAITDIKIIVFDGLLAGHEAYFHHPCLIPALNDKAQIERARHISKQTKNPMPCVIHIDTGMSRLGLPLNDWQAIKHDGDLKDLNIQMIMSHLASADLPDSPQNRMQLSSFQKALEDTNHKASFANSGGIFLGNDYHFDVARPGLALYGLTPDNSDQNLEMTFRWTADILQIRTIQKGMSVGYGASFVAKKDMKLATIGVGYADGFLRRSQQALSVRIGDIDCPLVGRVSMDSCVVDISALNQQQIETATQAIIIDDAVSAHNLANRTDTIIYEVMTILGERVLRHYDDGDVTLKD